MQTGRVCLFAHYDPVGRIARYVHRYLAHLSGCGFAVHLACSGLDRLPEADLVALGRIGARPHFRPNAGHDFGAWQHLLRLGCADGAGEVLLANDSVFGPFTDLRPIFAEMGRWGLDAWGMVASAERGWHLQSWFLWLSADALFRPAVRRVLDQPFAEMSKREIVLHGELGLGAALKAEGLACGARFEEPKGSRLRRLARINPMHLDWAFMLTSGLVPFLKIELLRDNPIRIPWAHRWRAVLARVSDYPAALIEEQLGRDAGRSRPPPWRTRLLYLLLTRDKGVALRAMLSPGS